MAVTATFQADFTAFKTAVQQAEITLKGLESGAGKVERALSSMADKFSGRKVIQEATLMAEAIDRLGGVSILTEAEQQRVNRAVTEAIAKYTALGQVAPPALQQLADATAKVNAPSGSFLTTLRETIPTTKSLVGQVQAMALGYVSGTLALEGFKRVGETVVDFVVDSVKAYTQAEGAQRKLVTALEAQGQATPAVIRQYKDLATQYQQTTVFSSSLIKETESLLVQVGQVMPSQMDLALRATTDLASGLNVDLRQATLTVARAFEDNFGALKKAGVQIDETRAQAEGMAYVLGQIEARFGGQAQSDARSYEGQVKQLGNSFDDLKESIGEVLVKTKVFAAAITVARIEIGLLKSQLDAQILALKVLSELPGPLGVALSTLGFELGDVRKKSGDYGKDVDLAANKTLSFSQQLAAAKAALAALTTEQRANLKAAIDLNVKTEDIQKTFGITAGAVAVFKDQLQEAAAAQRKAEEAAKVHKRQMEDWTKVMSEGANTSLTAFLKEMNRGTTLIIPAHIVQTMVLSEANKNLSGELYQVILALLRAGVATGEIEDQLKKARLATDSTKSSSVSLKFAIDSLADSIKLSAKAVESHVVPLRNLLVILPQFKAYLDLSATAAFTLRDANRQLSPEVREAANAFLRAGMSASDTLEELKKLGVATDADKEKINALAKAQDGLSKALQSAGQTFTQLAQVSGRTWGPIVGGIGQAVVAVGALTKAMQDLQRSGAGGGGFNAGNLAALATSWLGIGIATFNITRGLIEARRRAEDFERASEAAARAAEAAAMWARELAETEAFQSGLDAMTAAIVEQTQALGVPSRRLLADWKAILDVAEKYGLTIDDLGASFRRMRASGMLQELASNFVVLRLATDDINVVFGAMREQAQGVINDALRWGTEIPTALRPLAQNLIDLGLLFDATGQQITDISQIPFAESFRESTDRILDGLNDIIIVLLGGLPESFDFAAYKFRQVADGMKRDAQEAASGINAAFTGINIGGSVDTSAGTSTEAATAPIVKRLGFSSGGIVPQYLAAGDLVSPWVPRGTDTVPAMLTPGELVLSRSDAQRYTNGGGGQMVSVNTPIVVHSVVQLDGYAFGRASAKYTIADLLKAGV